MLNRMALWLSKRPVVYYGLPPVMWMVLIFAVSAQPMLPSMPGRLLDTVAKKTAHMLEYAILLLLLWRVFFGYMTLFSGSETRQRLVKALGLAFVVCVLYAASDEFHQTFVPGRRGRLLDVGIDSVGAALAAIGVWCLKRTRI